MKLAQGALPWILPALVLTISFASVTSWLTGFLQGIVFGCAIVFFVLSLLLIIFFRDPERTPGKGLVAPADGTISRISKVKDKDIGECMIISIFMNVYNVHVNRMPLAGTIKQLVHIEGAHVPAFTKDSDRNERVIMLLQTEIGVVKLVQIAGTLARRIVPYVKQGETVNKGERIGMIRLGSRVDVYLPRKKIKQVTVTVHERIHAGEDTIAEIHA